MNIRTDRLRATALQWAMKPPRHRLAHVHRDTVFANFADVFKSREDFELRLVVKAKKQPPPGEPGAVDGTTPETAEATDCGG